MKSSELYFTSDTHFGHKAMVERFGRPFADVDEMDEALIERWNAVVPAKGAHVFHLGDVSFRNSERTAAILIRLHGTKYLVKGNHDRLSGALTTPFQWVKDYYELKVEDTGQRLVMCHYAFRVWNRAHYGAWNLHGHSHGNLPNVGGQMDVGSDTNHWRPYSYAEVSAFLAVRPYLAVDHHRIQV